MRSSWPGCPKLVQQCNSLTAQVLAHLVELDERQLHLERGFASLFSYCVEGLGMSEGTAGRRVTATRVCRRFPQAFERVARGDLHLCALCALAPHLTDENAAELFAACKRKTRRQIEELLAVRFPRPDVREQIRRLPKRAQGAVAVVRLAGPVLPPVAAEPGALVQLATVSKVEENPGPPSGSIGHTSFARPRGRELEPLSADRFGVHFTADVELRDLIERARALASHRIPKGDLAGLMKLAISSFVEREEKRRFGAKPRRSGERLTSSESKVGPEVEMATPPGGASVTSGVGEVPTKPGRVRFRKKQGRYLTVGVRREVYARDGGQCAFVSADGRRCTARALLQFDHVVPYVRLGASQVGNMRLLCQAHNLWHARRCFGAKHVAVKIAARRRSDCSAVGEWATEPAQ
jgi:hypothetical protein